MPGAYGIGLQSQEPFMAKAFPFRLCSLSSMWTDLHRKCLLITEHLLPGVFLYNRGKSQCSFELGNSAFLIIVPQDSWRGVVGSTPIYRYSSLIYTGMVFAYELCIAMHVDRLYITYNTQRGISRM